MFSQQPTIPPAAAAARRAVAAPTSAPPETDQVVRGVVAGILDVGAPSAAYYQTVANHIAAHDPDMMNAIRKLAGAVRNKYRSAWEHSQHVARVGCTKCVDSRVRHALDDDCALCLKPLRGPHRLIRLQAASRSPTECGHFFHASCVANWELANWERHRLGQRMACPMCRADLGTAISAWDDHEASDPRF